MAEDGKNPSGRPGGFGAKLGAEDGRMARRPQRMGSRRLVDAAPAVEAVSESEAWLRRAHLHCAAGLFVAAVLMWAPGGWDPLGDLLRSGAPFKIAMALATAASPILLMAALEAYGQELGTEAAVPLHLLCAILIGASGRVLTVAGELSLSMVDPGSNLAGAHLPLFAIAFGAGVRSLFVALGACPADPTEEGAWTKMAVAAGVPSIAAAVALNGLELPGTALCLLGAVAGAGYDLLFAQAMSQKGSGFGRRGESGAAGALLHHFAGFILIKRLAESHAKAAAGLVLMGGAGILRLLFAFLF